MAPNPASSSPLVAGAANGRSRRQNRAVARSLLLVLLVVGSAACGAPGASAPASDHAGHVPDPATESIKAELGEKFGMSFASAGPHHELGTATNGVQLDLVGVPPEQIVLSVPADEPGRVEELAAPYLPYLPRLLNAQRSIGADLLNEALAAWDGEETLDKERSADGITAHLTSTHDPAYVVLDVHHD